MFKYLCALLLLVSVTAVAQLPMYTGRIAHHANSNIQWATSNVSAPPYQTMNQGIITSGSCVPTPIATKPHVAAGWYPNVYSQDNFFKLRTNSWVYPNNVNIYEITVRICYHLNGTVPETMFLVPVLIDTNNGNRYEPSGGAITIPAGTYSPTSTTQATLTNTVWDLSGFQLPSQDMSVGRFEFGFRVRTVGFNGALQPAALKINGMDWRMKFTPTLPLQTAINQPVLTYTQGVGSFLSGTIRISQDVVTPISNTQPHLHTVRCNNGIDVDLEVIPWGSGPDFVKTYSINFINSTACSSSPLVQGTSTRIGSWPMTPGGTKMGTPAYRSILLF